MAELFVKQAKQYAHGRPSYPAELFEFIASKKPDHDIVWDVGTGNGRAAQSLAGIYKTVIATDTSLKQLQLASKLPNIFYRHTSPTMSIAEVKKKVGPEGSLDLVTIAQALHWFDRTAFYRNVRWVLKKPHGIVAAWCCSRPEVNGSVDAALGRLSTVDLKPYWHEAHTLIDEKFETIDFPFEPVDGEAGTGPFLFVAEKEMDFEKSLTYVRSWSAYQTAKEKGVEIQTSDVAKELEVAWNENGKGQKVAKFPIHLRIGKVGDT